MPERLCGWCGDPLPADSHPNRRLHPECRAQRPCAVDGCPNPLASDGLCETHRSRQRLGESLARPIGRTGRPKTDPYERVVKRLDRDLPGRQPDECWEWPGKRILSGYGVVSQGTRGRNGVPKYVHRIVAEAVHGGVTAESVVRHLCDNPPCCNPAHLRVGTQSENMHDRWRKERSA